MTDLQESVKSPADDRKNMEEGWVGTTPHSHPTASNKVVPPSEKKDHLDDLKSNLQAGWNPNS